MKIIIAEKPQLAQVIAEAIGIISRKTGYFECKNNYVVTNEQYKDWHLEDLPLQVRPIPLKSGKEFEAYRKLNKADKKVELEFPKNK